MFKRKANERFETLTETRKPKNRSQICTSPILLPGRSSYTPFITNDEILKTIEENRIQYPVIVNKPSKALLIEFGENSGENVGILPNKKPLSYTPTKIPEFMSKEYDIDNKFKKTKRNKSTKWLETTSIPVDSPYWYPAIIEAEPPRNPFYNYHDKFITLSDGERVRIRMFKDGTIMVIRAGETKILRPPSS